MKASEREKFGKFLSVLGIMEDFQEQYTSHRAGSSNGTFFFGTDEASELKGYLADVPAPDVFRRGFEYPIVDAEPWQSVEQLWKEELAREDSSDDETVEVPKKAPEKELKNVPSVKSGYKFCPRCYQLKRVTEFFSNAENSDGLYSYCRSCSTSDERKLPEVHVMNIHEGVCNRKKIFLSQELGSLVSGQHITGATFTTRGRHFFLSFGKKCKSRNLKYFTRSNGFAIQDEGISKALADFFSRDLDDTFYIHVSKNTSKKTGQVTVEVLKAYTVEEYRDIRFVSRDKLSEQALVTKKEKPKPDIAVPATDDDKADLFEQLCSSLGIATSDMVHLSAAFVYLHPDGCGNEGEGSNETWLAVVLKNLGWKLQRPVRTIKYEDF